MKIKITLGRHCCLWCVIKSQQLKESSSTRRQITPRSIDSIANDYEGFVKAGGVTYEEPTFTTMWYKNPSLYLFPCHKYASYFINNKLLNRPLIHCRFVHLDYRLFPLLEDACHQLDLSASLQGSECGPSYERYSSALGKLTNLKDELSRLQNELTVLEQTFTFLAATLPNASANLQFLSLITQVGQKEEGK